MEFAFRIRHQILFLVRPQDHIQPTSPASGIRTHSRVISHGGSVTIFWITPATQELSSATNPAEMEHVMKPCASYQNSINVLSNVTIEVIIDNLIIHLLLMQLPYFLLRQRR